MPNQQNPQSTNARPQNDRDTNYGQQAKNRGENDRDEDKQIGKDAPAYKGNAGQNAKH